MVKLTTGVSNITCGHIIKWKTVNWKNLKMIPKVMPMKKGYRIKELAAIEQEAESVQLTRSRISHMTLLYLVWTSTDNVLNWTYNGRDNC